MAIILQMRPQDRAMSWAQFRSSRPPFSIAIDGYVNERPLYDLSGPYANFNHHEGVSRLETRATCAQVQMAIRLGLYKRFRDDDGPCAEIYTNDCDEDVCLSWFLLSHPHLAESMIHPGLNRLVDISEKMDTTAGMYPLSVDTPILHQIAWVMEPYRRFRWSGGLNNRDPESFLNIVTNVCHRIEKHIMGEGESISLDIRYEKVGGGKEWSFIREIGPYGRQGAFADGIRAFVTVRERPDGKWTYSLGRASEFIPFDITSIIDAINQHETGPDRWGGGSTIGGSPRTTGSSLSPREVTAIIEEVLHPRPEPLVPDKKPPIVPESPPEQV